MNRVSEELKPWYREFWAWFVFTPLIVVIIACTFTVSIAFKYKDDVVDNDYYKVGKMINNGFEPEQRARTLGLVAKLETRSNRFVVELDESEWLADDVLLLSLSHPFQKDLDTFITLKRTAELTWQATKPIPADGKWYVKLSSIDDDGVEVWRLHGELRSPIAEAIVMRADIIEAANTQVN